MPNNGSRSIFRRNSSKSASALSRGPVGRWSVCQAYSSACYPQVGPGAVHHPSRRPCRPSTGRPYEFAPLMRKYFVAGMRVLGIVLVAHALMLLGADEIATIEAGGIRTIRSLEYILTLYGADPKAWDVGLPAPLALAAGMIMSLPGWAVLAAIGGVLSYVARPRE